jgi:hypothetical protein
MQERSRKCVKKNQTSLEEILKSSTPAGEFPKIVIKKLLAHHHPIFQIHCRCKN